MKYKSFVAPTRGWVSAANLAAAPKGAAFALENWYPTATGIRMRSGCLKHATASEAGDPVETLMEYVGAASRKLFAATDGNIIDVTTVADAETEPTAAVSGQNSNYYSYVNFATEGGNFLEAVNGTDPLELFDGANWYPITGTALYALNFDAQTADFTVGSTLTGSTSGAHGTIVKSIDAGTTGTLWLNAVTGTFQDNETITGSGGGSATANGLATLLFNGVTGGLSTSAIHAVANYRTRIWFAEGGSMNAWYLPVNSLVGAATKFPLAGVFKRGGHLEFIASWSIDATTDPKNYIVFVSTEGEVAVYSGDPDSTSDPMQEVGLYQASPPLGRNAFAEIGGDLLILTRIGIIPLSQIRSKDPAALALASISRDIQPDWQAEVQERMGLPWEMVKWTERNIAYVTCPVTADYSTTPPICFAVNLETGAWSKVTGWNTRSMALHDGLVFFGTNDGKVMQADVTGADDGQPIYYKYVGHMDHLGAPGQFKTLTQVRAVFRAYNEFNPLISATTNYEENLPAYPSAASPSGSPGEWDVGLWDVAKWDSGRVYSTAQTYWVSVGLSGFAHAPMLLVTSGSAAAPSAELVAFDAAYLPGGVVV